MTKDDPLDFEQPNANFIAMGEPRIDRGGFMGEGTGLVVRTTLNAVCGVVDRTLDAGGRRDR